MHALQDGVHKLQSFFLFFLICAAAFFNILKYINQNG
nr:MAG TPA: Ribosome associated membrane protein RAMP4 [Inoviridae sp.]